MCRNLQLTHTVLVLRRQESVSEDPWLNGAYASQFVRGFQGTDDSVPYTKVAACCKHFYAYSLEGADGFTRHNFDAKVTPRDLAETYQPAFTACVAAQPEQIMCSYNSVNGIPTCLDDKAQNGFLRNKLGFKGLIVSDCDAVADAWTKHKYCADAPTAAALGIKAGCDQDCGNTYKASNLQTALAAGKLTEPELDLALGRIMTMRFNLGMFDGAAHVPYTRINNTVLNDAAGQQRQAAAARRGDALGQDGGDDRADGWQCCGRGWRQV
jgi:beta-glucosidase-like glycosyl hydrolase